MSYLRMLALCFICTGVGISATVTALYDFNNTLNPVSSVSSPSATALREVDPGSVSGFQSDTVNGQNRTVFRFDGSATPALAQGGLQFLNANLMNANNYSVELYFSFDAVSSWRRILDTRDRTLDTGFYVLNGGLQLYPSNTGVGTFNSNTYYHVLLTFGSNTAVAYLNGSAQSTQATDYYSLPPSNVISLFLDNTASAAQNEYSSGKIAWARFWDGALTADEAAAAYRSAVAFDPGTPPITNVPEPSTLILAAAGLLLATGIAGVHRIR